MDAFVLVRTRPGKLEEVLIQLEAARGVRHAVAVFGDWDVLVAVSGPDLTTIAMDVVRSIQRIDGIVRTRTMPVVPGHVVGLAGGGLGSPMPMSKTGPACFVRVRTAPDETTAVFDALKEMEEVTGLALVAGEDDLLAEIAFGWEEAARLILDRIRRLPGVASTSTLVGIGPLPVEEEDRDQFSAWS